MFYHPPLTKILPSEPGKLGSNRGFSSFLEFTPKCKAQWELALPSLPSFPTLGSLLQRPCARTHMRTWVPSTFPASSTPCLLLRSQDIYTCNEAHVNLKKKEKKVSQGFGGGFEAILAGNSGIPLSDMRTRIAAWAPRGNALLDLMISHPVE